MDNSREDFITFGLKSLPDIQFICVYLPPSDSPYFTVDNVSRTNALVSSKPGGKFIILADINSRFGKLRSCFLDNKVVGNHWSYEPVSHDTRQNTNAKYIVDCLAPSLVLLNGLSTEQRNFCSQQPYRMTNRWVSELDYCLLSPELVGCVMDFNIDQSAQLPSNHAPLILKLRVTVRTHTFWSERCNWIKSRTQSLLIALSRLNIQTSTLVNFHNFYNHWNHLTDLQYRVMLTI